MVMQMSLFDHSLNEVAEMNGLDRTYFMNDVCVDYLMAKDLHQPKMEKFYFELLKQLIKDYGN